jgi:hypothetical protein
MKKNAKAKVRNCSHCKKALVGSTSIPGFHDGCAQLAINERIANQAIGQLQTLRLRLIRTVTFARSEATNYDTYKGELRGVKLGREDVVLFMSLTQNQVAFVYAPHSIETSPGRFTEVLRSARFRLRGRAGWNPLMIANYASEVGIKLDGLKRFEEHYDKLRREAARSVAKRLGVSKEMKAA